MKDLLEWSQRIAAIATTGLHFASSHEDRYHRERYDQLLGIAAEMGARAMNKPLEAIRNELASEEGYITPKVDVRAGLFENDRTGLPLVPGYFSNVRLAIP